MSMKYDVRGEVHNARKCTFDGRDFWIGALLLNGKLLDVSSPDVSTRTEAEAWCRAEARKRGYESIRVTTRIEQPDGSYAWVQS